MSVDIEWDKQYRTFKHPDGRIDYVSTGVWAEAINHIRAVIEGKPVDALAELTRMAQEDGDYEH